MIDNLVVTDVDFYPSKEATSFVGIVSIYFNHSIVVNNCFVHKADELTHGCKYRVVYPQPKGDKIDKPYVCPLNKATQKMIDADVSSYIIAQEKLNA
jgi:hypothetical protein